jgi:predicted metalloendopeptidase
MLKYDSGNQMGYSVINAFYMPTSNIFVLPYGILGRPFFEINRPVSMNFGSIGMVSAHELSQ